jgi:hypothetical protein
MKISVRYGAQVLAGLAFLTAPICHAASLEIESFGCDQAYQRIHNFSMDLGEAADQKLSSISFARAKKLHRLLRSVVSSKEFKNADATNQAAVAAFAAHHFAAEDGIHEPNIKKFWMFSKPKGEKPRFEVVTTVRGNTGQWWALDPQLEKPVYLEEWYRERREARLNLNARVRFFRTPVDFVAWDSKAELPSKDSSSMTDSPLFQKVSKQVERFAAHKRKKVHPLLHPRVIELLKNIPAEETKPTLTDVEFDGGEDPYVDDERDLEEFDSD